MKFITEEEFLNEGERQVRVGVDEMTKAVDNVINALQELKELREYYNDAEYDGEPYLPIIDSKLKQKRLEFVLRTSRLFFNISKY